MKGIYVLLIIIAALLASVLLHSQKIKTERDELDGLATVLRPAKAMTAHLWSIAFTTEPEGLALFLKTRYLMAPLHLQYGSVTTADTMLSIQLTTGGDSLLRATLLPRRILWQAADDIYTYKLTTR